MKHPSPTILASLLLFGAADNPALAATVWDGPTINFVKSAGSDPNLPANQDRITANVWITRGNSQGIYNASSEAFFTHFSSPADTEWANGSLANYNTLTYTDWNTWAKNINGGPPGTVGINAVVHLMSEDIYLAVRFTSWGGAGADGGFSYERSTPNAGAFITAQPQSQAVNLGSNAMFCVTAGGIPPLSYQWRFNGTNISGATNPCYTRTNAQFADAGDYAVVVTNSSGSITSAVATLSVTTVRITWSTIAGGGGVSTDAVTTVRGTIGQWGAGRLSGGNTSVVGGFWGIVAVQTPGAPTLSITQTTTNTVMVSWPWPSTGFVLQQNTNLATANWISPSETLNTNSTLNFIMVNPPNGNRFYRLFKP